ncbi:MAG: DUF5941 domain-containing protein, partial [Nitriliruptoraceae bacterium]
DGPTADRVLAPHRDDGPLALLAPRAVLVLPAILLLAASLVLLALAATTATGTLDLGPVWWWAAGALVLGIAAAWGRSLPRLDWPIPALLRVLEYGTVLVLAGTSPWSYALLATLAIRHYDIVYRVRLLGTAPPRWLALATGGWPVRCALLVLAAAFGVAEPATATLAVLLAPVVVGETLVHWIGRTR